MYFLKVKEHKNTISSRIGAMLASVNILGVNGEQGVGNPRVYMSGVSYNVNNQDEKIESKLSNSPWEKYEKPPLTTKTASRHKRML
jgi:hypothetical protein